jgi:N-acetylmuramoyl-L-alanine amidase
VNFQREHLLFIFTLLIFCNMFAQDSLLTVTAKNGDGIFSVLRNQGIDIVKYYAKFIELNEEKIKNGSHLIIGEEYLIPNAPDSFRNMGLSIQLPSGKETPIFKNNLASLERKDSTLQNAVYYLITDKSNGSQVNLTKLNDEIVQRMARKLLEHGARVYVLDNSLNDSLNLMDFASLVNKRYLRHNGAYQRLLVIKADDDLTKSKTEVTVYHYAESREGKKMANNILKVLGGNTVKHKSIGEYSQIFTDFKDVSFAKNILPTITFIEMGRKSDKTVKTLRVSSNKRNIVDLITSGILSDYSTLQFDDN